MLDETKMLTPVLMGLAAMLANKAFTGLPNLFRGSATTAAGLSRVLPTVAEGLGNFGLMGTRAGVALYGLQGSLGSAATATTGFLATASAFIPWAVGAAVAVGGLMWAYDHFNESLDEEKERLSQSISARKDEIKSIDEQKGKLQEIQKEYDKLSNKPKKTAEELKRLTELTNQIAQIRPDLVIGTDENGNAILSMTNDVKDLIAEMDRANESKKRLLRVEQVELGENSIKQLHGNGKTNSYMESNGYKPDTEMNKLESLTSDHVVKMMALEGKRDKILNQMYASTGKERQALLKDLEKANYNIEKQQSNFTQDYQEQLNVIKEYSDTIGDGVFASLENSSAYKNMGTELQGKFSELKKSLDFSDIETEDELLDVEMALSSLMKAAANGDVNIDKVSESIKKANDEFAKTGDAEKYDKAISNIISTLEKSTGKDFSVLKDVFEGMDTSILKGKDALDEFLRAYGKTKADIEKDDGFAKALANQKRQIEQAIEELNSVTGNAEIDLELAYDIVNNKELPMELRDIVRTLINQGKDGTEIVKFAQELLVDISDGEINIDEANEKIKQKFGETGIEITPDILLSDDTKTAGAERVIEQLKERFEEVPPVVKTVIEAEGVTAFNSAKWIMETYEEIPDEVKTEMKNNGAETLADIIKVDAMLSTLPPEVVTNILSNYPDIVEGAGNLDQLLRALPPEVVSNIATNYPEVVESSQLLQGVLKDIPPTVNSVVNVKENVEKAPGNIFDKLFKKDSAPMTATAIITAQVNNEKALTDVESKINSLTKNGKSVELKADTSDVDKKSNDTQSKVDNIKQKTPTKVNVDNISANNRLKTTKGHLDEIKSKSVTLTVNTKYTTTGSKPSGVGNIGRSGEAFSVPVEPQMMAMDSQVSTMADINNQVSAMDSANSQISTFASNYSSLDKNTAMDYFNLDVNAFKNIEDALKKINAQLDILDKKSELAFGSEKAYLLKQQLSLLIQQQSLQRDMSKDMEIYRNELKYLLTQNGVLFDKNGDVINQQKKLLDIDKQIKSLQEKSNNSKDESAKKSYDSQVDSLGKVKKALEEYTNMSNVEIPGATSEWYDLQKQIEETKVAILEAKKEQENFRINLEIKDLQADIKDIENELEMLDIQIERAFGEDKDKLLKQKSELLKEQQKELHKLAEQYRVQAKSISEFLNQQGFIIEPDGDIGNFEHLEKLKDSDIYEHIKEQLEEYIDLTNEKIPELEVKWWDLENTIDDVKNAIVEAKFEMADLKADIDLKNFEQSVDKIHSEINRLDKDIDSAFGKKKEDLINKKIEAIKREQQELHKLANAYREQAKIYSQFLNNEGFIIGSNGSIGNMDHLLNLMERPNYEAIKEALDKYLSLQGSIGDLSGDWWGLQDSIESAKDEIEEARKELEKFLNEAKVEALVDKFNDLSHEISVLDKLMEHATWDKKLDLMAKKTELLKEQQKELQKQFEYFENQKNSLQMELSSLGFTFDSDGDISNYVSQLESLANTADNFDDIKDKIEEYLELQNEKLPELEENWLDIENAIKDALKEQLEITTEIEKKITEVYKKEVEERKKLIDKETKAKLDALKKQQDAYNKYRDEADYKRDYEDQLDLINDLQRQIDIASKDGSLSGQKKLQDLLKQLADEQRKLEDLVQDKIDSDVNDMFDKESDRIQEEADKKKEDLDEKYSDENLKEIVKDALTNGVFVDLDGNIKDLEDTLLEFEDKFGDGMYAIGSIIKDQLIGNLELAKDTIKDMSSVLNGLDLGSFAREINKYSAPDLNSIVGDKIGSTSSVVNFNESLIKIEGNVSSDMLPDLERVIKEAEKRITKEIVRSIR